MDTPEKHPTPPAPPTIFRDLRARNKRHDALRPFHAERKQRIERVIEATRYRARSSLPFQPGRNGRSNSDRA
jgi:hypothetical protein